jgi:hypothetical protein
MRMQLFWLTFIICGGMLQPAWGHDADEHGVELRPGYVGYQHGKYHKPYERFWIEINGDSLGLGDEKYLQEKYGGTYKQLYSSGKCACKSGYCRPTLARPTQLDAETGYDVIINGEWVPVPKGTLHHEKSLSPELWAALMAEAGAHVCAYPDTTAPYGQRIECVIVPEFIG